MCAVPFENLDVQLQRPVSTSVEAAYEKIVVDRRGGWCYEQNGLFGWVLNEIGFSVTRVAASVMRDESKASAANHLCLLVKLSDSNRKYLVDVGFGGSLLRPIELKEGHHEQPPFKLGLERDWTISIGDIGKMRAPVSLVMILPSNQRANQHSPKNVHFCKAIALRISY